MALVCKHHFYQIIYNVLYFFLPARMRFFSEMKPSRIGGITLPFTDAGNDAQVTNFNCRKYVFVFNAIRETKILSKI